MKASNGDPRSQEQVLSSRNVLGGPLSPDSGYTLVFPISGPKPQPNRLASTPSSLPLASTFPREGQTHLIYEVFPPLCLGIPQRLQCVVAPPPLPRSPSPSSFCLGVWECLLFPGGVREKVDKLWVGRFPVLSSHVPSMAGGQARNDDHWFLWLPTRARFWRSEGGWEGFASNLPLCLPCPPHSLLPKPPPTGQGSIFSIQEPKGERKLKVFKCSLCARHCARPFYKSHLNSFLESF